MSPAVFPGGKLNKMRHRRHWNSVILQMKTGRDHHRWYPTALMTIAFPGLKGEYVRTRVEKKHSQALWLSGVQDQFHCRRFLSRLT